jgi:hypothetical protein
LTIAVGTAIAGCPPHRSGRALVSASGSYLGCVAAKRASGKGWSTAGGGSQRFARVSIRVQLIRCFWPILVAVIRPGKWAFTILVKCSCQNTNLGRVLNQNVSRTRRRVVAFRSHLSPDISCRTLCSESRDYLDWLLARSATALCLSSLRGSLDREAKLAAERNMCL